MSKHPNYVCLNQFENHSNPLAHYEFTGKEIIDTMQKNIDCFVSVIGSGGTITGVAKRLKETLSNVRIIGVQPKGCNILENVYVPHKIQATAVGKVGSFFAPELIDEMVDVEFEEVQTIRNYLAQKQGIFIGISGGANVLAAFHESKKYTITQNIVTIAPDSGKSYL